MKERNKLFICTKNKLFYTKIIPMTKVVEKIGISAELLHTFDNLPLPNPDFPFFQLLNF